MKMSDELKRQMLLYVAIISFFEEENIYKALDTLGEGTGNKITPVVKCFLENIHSEDNIEVEINKLEVEAATEIIKKLLLLFESKQNEPTKETMS